MVLDSVLVVKNPQKSTSNRLPLLSAFRAMVTQTPSSSVYWASANTLPKVRRSSLTKRMLPMFPSFMSITRDDWRAFFRFPLLAVREISEETRSTSSSRRGRVGSGSDIDRSTGAVTSCTRKYLANSTSHKRQSPGIHPGLTKILNDACQVNSSNRRWLVNQDYKVRVTAEGEGVEP